MQIQNFELKTESIELYKLLKLLQLAHSGGMAKILIEEGEVFVNQEVETRKRAKIKKGDVVQFRDRQINVA